MTDGDIAVCSRGEIGLITSPFKQRIVYKRCDYCVGAISGADIDNACECETGYAWVGIHLGKAKLGQPWSSRNPKVIGNIDRLLAESNVYQAILSTACQLDHLPEGSY